MDEEADAGDECISELITNAIQALEELKRRLGVFRLRRNEFTGDLSLYGFLRGCWECGNAALCVARDTEYTVGAYPCARASFEAAEDALLLVTEQFYSEAGARVRVFERLEHADLKQEMHKAFADDDDEGPTQGYGEAAASVEKDAANWDTDCPGRGELLRSALAHFQPLFAKARNGGRHPSHWSSLNRRRMAAEIGRRVADPPFAQSLAATYAQLSRASHPRFRIESWEKYRAESGAKRFRRHPREARIILGIIELSARTASMAFDRIKGDELR